MKKIISVFFIAISFHFSFAQTYQANINSISKEGLHEIILSPEIRSASNNNADLLRIFDSKDNEVPYVVLEKKSDTSELKSLEIISKKTIPNVSTSIIIINENNNKLDHILLTIANSDVDKKYSISGSYDNQQWFGLVNNQMIYNLNELGKTNVQRKFSFPLNDYKYLKFDFIDKNSLPINVLGASLEKNNIIKNSQIELTDFEQKTTTNKQNKTTTIDIIFRTPQIIDGIKFQISAPNFYSRNAKIFVKKNRTYKKRQESYYETVSQFQLASKSNNEFRINGLLAKEFSIEIENQDNIELKFQKISLFQNSVSILADLKKDENYSLKINSNYSKPNYDMMQSGINFDENFPVATVSKLVKIDKKQNPSASQKFWETPLFMWICIIIAVVIIGYFSIVMIKDMNKEK